MLPILSDKTAKTPHSVQLRAVLLILTADPYLYESVAKFIDRDTESIHWDHIFKIQLCPSHKGVLSWCYSLWTDEVRVKTNPFDAVLAVDSPIQKAILQALALRWGLN